MILMPNNKIINACNLHLVAMKYMPNSLARCTSYERHDKRDHQKPVVWYRTSVPNAIDSKDTPSMMALVGYRAVIQCIIDAYNKYHWKFIVLRSAGFLEDCNNIHYAKISGFILFIDYMLRLWHSTPWIMNGRHGCIMTKNWHYWPPSQ